MHSYSTRAATARGMVTRWPNRCRAQAVRSASHANCLLWSRARAQAQLGAPERVPFYVVLAKHYATPKGADSAVVVLHLLQVGDAKDTPARAHTHTLRYITIISPLTNVCVCVCVCLCVCVCVCVCVYRVCTDRVTRLPWSHCYCTDGCSCEGEARYAYIHTLLHTGIQIVYDCDMFRVRVCVCVCVCHMSHTELQVGVCQRSSALVWSTRCH